MPSYYEINNASLSKLAHHSGMADVHAYLSGEYYAKKDKLSSGSDNDSRKMHFYDAALSHHRHETSYNENQEREHKAGRTYSASAYGSEAKPDDDMTKGARAPSTVYEDKGRLMSRIAQQSKGNASVWNEQGHNEDIRNAGGTTPVNDNFRNQRFV